MTPGGVLILTQCFPPAAGGVENLMGGLAEALSEAGENVEVFADGRSAGIDAALPFPVRRFGGLKFLRREAKARAAARALRKAGAARVFCDSWKSLERLPSDCCARSAVFAHGSEYPPAAPARKRRRIEAALAKAERVFAVSRAAQERMRLGSAAEAAARAAVWHPPLRAPSEPSEDDENRARSLWNGGSLRLLTVSRLAARKGVDTAVRAAAALSQEFPGLRYVIAGDGAEATALRDLAAQSGAGECVRFAGEVGEGAKSALYGSADIFVLPSRPAPDGGADMEGFGIVFLEAGYYGLPAAAGNAGGAAEAVEDGQTGMLCDGGSPESLIQVLRTLASDEELRRRLGENARQKARAALWPRRVGELLRVL